MQNIPSKNNEIRLMFTASEGNVLVGSDFSQQEPRLLSEYSGDEKMIGAYREGKDLYATIGTGVFHNNYWDNMEHHEDGSPNPEGKTRRKKMKILLLGIMYGMGSSSIASSLGISLDEAQSIIDNFYNGFPKVRKWIDKTIEDAKINLYVEDFWGRRRRFPDFSLPKFEIKRKDESAYRFFNPILGCKGIEKEDSEINDFREMLSNARGKKQIENIIDKANKCGIVIKDNSGFISQAERQCVNARVQGGAASMSKIAMIKVHKSQELKSLGFKLLLAIHDELIGECPYENRDKVADILSTIMKESAKPQVSSVPFKCDAEIEKQWYLNDYSDHLVEEYDNFVPQTKDKFNEFACIHSEMTKEKIKEILGEI